MVSAEEQMGGGHTRRSSGLGVAVNDKSGLGWWLTGQAHGGNGRGAVWHAQARVAWLPRSLQAQMGEVLES